MKYNPVQVDELDKFGPDVKNIVNYALEVMESAMPNTFRWILRDVTVWFPGEYNWTKMVSRKSQSYSGVYQHSMKRIVFNPAFMRGRKSRHQFTFWNFVKLLAHEMVHAYRWNSFSDDEMSIWQFVYADDKRKHDYYDEPEEKLAYDIQERVANYIRNRVLPRRDDTALLDFLHQTDD
jgi:hypothetical protein